MNIFSVRKRDILWELALGFVHLKIQIGSHFTSPLRNTSIKSKYCKGGPLLLDLNDASQFYDIEYLVEKVT